MNLQEMLDAKNATIDRALLFLGQREQEIEELQQRIRDLEARAALADEVRKARDQQGFSTFWADWRQRYDALPSTTKETQ